MRISRGVFGLGAALLFGLSTPLAKLIVCDVSPVMLAGWLYLGSGVGLLLITLLTHIVRGKRFEFSRLKPVELGYFAGAILLGGMVAPVLLMTGLRTVSGSITSLLLNLEGALTALVACFIFHERYGRRLVVGLICILSGGLILAGDYQNGSSTNWMGILCIAAATGCWALDNNFTNQVQSIEATTVASLKGLAAGIVNISIGLAIGQAMPSMQTIFLAGVIGFFGYGFSLVLFILSLRSIGAARTSAYFSTAPFVGAALSILLFREPLQLRMAFAGALMGIGVYLHLTEKTAIDVAQRPDAI